MADDSAKMIRARFPGKLFHEPCLARDDADPFDVKGLGSRRSTARTCDQKHPCLCVSADKVHFRRAHKLGKHLFLLVKALKKPIGETLIRLKHRRLRTPHLFWTTRISGNPRHVFFVKAEECAEPVGGVRTAFYVHECD